MAAHKVITIERGWREGRPAFAARCAEPGCVEVTFGGYASRREAREALRGHENGKGSPVAADEPMSQAVPAAENHNTNTQEDEGATPMVSPTNDGINPSEALTTSDLVSQLDAEPVGVVASNGEDHYTHLGGGRWTPDPGATPPPTITTRQLVAAATTTITVEGPERELPLPVIPRAPHLERFYRFVGEGHGSVLKGAHDPHPLNTTPCPAWCVVGLTRNDPKGSSPQHTIESGATHRSEPAHLPISSAVRKIKSGRYCLSSIAVHVTKFPNRHASPMVKIQQFIVADGGEVETTALYGLHPDEARRLAQTILAAADMIDPDGDFDTAGTFSGEGPA